MKYKGKLYAKIGDQYLVMNNDTEHYDGLEKENEDLKTLLSRCLSDSRKIDYKDKGHHCESKKFGEKILQRFEAYEYERKYGITKGVKDEEI